MRFSFVRDSSGVTVIFLKVKSRSFLRMSPIVEREGRLAM